MWADSRRSGLKETSFYRSTINITRKEDEMSDLPKSYRRFKDQHKNVWQAFDRLGASAAESGPLDPKVRELIKFGMSAAVKSQSAVQSHTHRALEVGASAEEIEHAIVLGITTMGFPTMMQALTWAKAAIQTHKE
jgi:4-carboxymuconolactone decarboxylase